MSGDRTTRAFWTTNHLANPILQLLLRSPVGVRLGRRLAVLRYRGRRSGQRHDLVVQYARDGAKVWIVSGQSARKVWWRNLREPSEVEVRLAGQELHGRAVALDGTEYPDEVRRGLEIYLRERPRAAKALGVRPSSSGPPEVELTDVVKQAVMVRIDLQGYS